MVDAQDEYTLFREITDTLPQEVRAFFDGFAASRAEMKLQLDAEALNAAAADEYRTCQAADRDAVLFKWFELFRDIYIASEIKAGEAGREVLKHPDNFATFTRSFEPLALLPEFWFADDSLAVRRNFRDRVYALRFAFERFLYARGGARAWGAVDWEMPRYIRERLCGRLRSGTTHALERLAALALTAHAVVTEELGLYLDEFGDVQLPLTGISNVRGQTKPLLKYFHYDRYTQLSYAREHEFAADVNFPGDHVEFEQRWLALAVIADFALKEADAHSTLFCATRAAFESVSRCMSRVRDQLEEKGEAQLQKAVSAVGTLFSALDFRPAARLNREELLQLTGVKRKVIPADYYLRKCRIADAQSFWKEALPIFDELTALINRNREETIPKYTERQRMAGFGDPQSAAVFISHAINYNTPAELREVSRASLRSVLQEMLASGTYELHPLTLARVVLGEDELQIGRVSVRSEAVGRSCELPAALPFGEGERAAFRTWIFAMWSDLALRCPLEDRVNGSTPARKPDYGKFDFREILQAADTLWDHYFTAEAACMERWVLSIAEALKILETCDRENYVKWQFKSGYVWPCDADFRRTLQARLQTEKAALTASGHWPRSLARLRKTFLAREPVTIDTVSPKPARYFVMLALFARLMTETAESYPGLWSNKDELFSFFIHILIATNPALEYPLPCHLNIFRDSYLRTARSRTRQRNAVDSIVDGRFGNEAERQILLMYLAHYLKRRPDGAAVLASIRKEESLAAYFGGERLDFLAAGMKREGRL